MTGNETVRSGEHAAIEGQCHAASANGRSSRVTIRRLKSSILLRMKSGSVLARFGIGISIVSCAAWSGSIAVAREPAAKIVESPKAREVVIVRMHRAHHAATESFVLAAGARILVGANTNATLADLTTGEVAHVAYTVENGTWFAHEIVVNPPHAPHAEKSIPAATPSQLHAHGAIISFNTSNGVLTLKRGH
jgi:hypothetical protein